MPTLEEMKSKYQSVLDAVKQQGVSLSHVNMQGDKLFIQGKAPSEQAKNKIWDQIKSVNPAYNDITADITVDPSLPQPQAAQAQGATAGSSGGGQKYTVQPGDSLSKISQKFYGSANKYQIIADANNIDDPNLIRAGQELTIPPHDENA